MRERGGESMEYPKTNAYDLALVREKSMGPNPLKLTEELLSDNRIPQGATVLDLGSGQGLTSVFLVREYGFTVYAADLWSDPRENRAFADRMHIPHDKLHFVKADAHALPFEAGFFDAVISTDSYNYFGREGSFLGEKLLPFVKEGGYIYICVPGMKRDCHEKLPPELLLSWNAEQLDYIHDADYWRGIISQTKGVNILSIHEMQSNEEVWNDWLSCDNDYARADRKSIEAGGGKYLNFIAIVLQMQGKAYRN